MSSIKKAFTILTLIALPVGCYKASGGNDDDLDVPDSPVDAEPIAARQQGSSVLPVSVDVKPDGLHLSVGSIPDGAHLECTLNETPLSSCEDGAVFNLPEPGDYVVDVDAFVDGRLVAFGRSAPFTVLPSGEGASPTGDAPLNLVLDDPEFRNGMAWPLTKDFTVKFKFFREPDCDYEIKCRYDSRTSPFWVSCGDDGKFTLKKELLASGLQYLSIRASCEERLGPELELFWYGVPEDYQPLMLRDVSDNHGRHIFNLVKADDCPESQQVFECALPSDPDGFSLCENGNVLDNPESGTKIRVRCDGVTGPEYVIP